MIHNRHFLMDERKKIATLIYGRPEVLKYYCHEVDALITN